MQRHTLGARPLYHFDSGGSHVPEDKVEDCAAGAGDDTAYHVQEWDQDNDIDNNEHLYRSADNSEFPAQGRGDTVFHRGALPDGPGPFLAQED